MADRKHSHYFRPFPYENIDIYRFLEVFDVTCPVAQHIIKKAVATGKRGHKDLQRDWQDIVDSAQRKLEMLDEDCQVDADSTKPEWFDVSEEILGENAVSLALQESLWYPDDIPGLEWKETTWEEPMFDNPQPYVYVLFRDERGGCW